jgi:hypothetical protein
LTLEVNETLLAQVTDSTFPDGRSGLFVGAFDPPGLAVSFDNFAVVRPAALQTEATSGDIVLEDDFSDPSSGWPRRTDERLIQDYTDGTYRIFVNDTDFDVWSTAGVDVDSVIVEADATFVNSPDDGVVGLICRYADPDNFYLAYVSATGASALYRTEEGERQSLLPDVWTQSSASYLGGGLNRFSFSCREDQLELRINGQLVADARDTTFARGDIALLAGSYLSPGVDVRFDNVVVRSP